MPRAAKRDGSVVLARQDQVVAGACVPRPHRGIYRGAGVRTTTELSRVRPVASREPARPAEPTAASFSPTDADDRDVVQRGRRYHRLYAPKTDRTPFAGQLQRLIQALRPVTFRS